MMLLLVLLSIALGSATTTSITSGGLDEAHTQWVAGVENVLANVVMGPFRPEFTPAFLTARMKESRATIVESQRNYFRAHVARLLLNSLSTDGLLHVTVPREYAPEVVEAQVQELKDHSFSVRWLAQGPGGDFVVNVPRSK